MKCWKRQWPVCCPWNIPRIETEHHSGSFTRFPVIPSRERGEESHICQASRTTGSKAGLLMRLVSPKNWGRKRTKSSDWKETNAVPHQKSVFLHSFGMFWGSISGEDLGVWSKSGTSLRHPYGFPQIFHHCNFGVPGVGECGFESWDLTPNKDSSIFRNLGFSVLKSMLWWEWRYAGFMWSIYCIIHIYIYTYNVYIYIYVR